MMCFTMWSIIKGITIDTFVELRQLLTARLEDTTQKCFMCGIERLTFNKALTRDAFDNHVKYEQNLWNYIYYFIFIWEQDKDDDDGLEYFIRHAMDEGDLGWFPMNKAIRLTEHLEKGEATSLQFLFREDLKGVEKELETQVTSFKDELAKFITRVENTLMFVPDPMGGNRKSRSRGFTGAMTPFTGGSPSGDGGIGTRGGTGSVVGVGGGDALDEARTVELTVLSIAGLVIPPEISDRIQCKVISDVNTTLLATGTPSGGEGVDPEGKTSVAFDLEQRLICHRGKLPPGDAASGYVVRLQLLYKALRPDDPLCFMGSVDVPISECVAAALRAHTDPEGAPKASVSDDLPWVAPLSVSSRQKAFLLPDQVNMCDVSLSVAVGSGLITDALNSRILSPGTSMVGAGPEDGAGPRVAEGESVEEEGLGAVQGGESLDGEHSVFEP